MPSALLFQVIYTVGIRENQFHIVDTDGNTPIYYDNEPLVPITSAQGIDEIIRLNEEAGYAST